MKLNGRIFHLYNDAQKLRDQLDGVDVQPSDEYVYGVNTDAMISGRACTLGYTPEVLGPYFLENFLETVKQSDVRSAGFQVVVGGDAYGSGSSREVAVVAHRGAGIELVVADSFQRIFQENMVYSGMPFTTDRSVLTKLEAGEDVDLDALSDALPPFFRAVSQAGGLMKYGTLLSNGEVHPTYETARETRPMNIVEKIVAARAWAGPAHQTVSRLSRLGTKFLPVVHFAACMNTRQVWLWTCTKKNGGLPLCIAQRWLPRLRTILCSFPTRPYPKV